MNGWHDTSTCAPLILCFLSVTFPASAKKNTIVSHLWNILYLGEGFLFLAETQ